MLAPHLVGMNGDVQSYLKNLVLKRGEKIEDFNKIIISLQQGTWDKRCHPPTMISWKWNITYRWRRDSGDDC